MNRNKYRGQCTHDVTHHEIVVSKLHHHNVNDLLIVKKPSGNTYSRTELYIFFQTSWSHTGSVAFTDFQKKNRSYISLTAGRCSVVKGFDLIQRNNNSFVYKYYAYPQEITTNISDFHWDWCENIYSRISYWYVS